MSGRTPNKVTIENDEGITVHYDNGDSIYIATDKAMVRGLKWGDGLISRLYKEAVEKKKREDDMAANMGGRKLVSVGWGPGGSITATYDDGMVQMFAGDVRINKLPEALQNMLLEQIRDKSVTLVTTENLSLEPIKKETTTMAGYGSYKAVDMDDVDYGGHLEHVAEMSDASAFSHNQANDMINRAVDTFGEYIKEVLKNGMNDDPEHNGEPWMAFAPSLEKAILFAIAQDAGNLANAAGSSKMPALRQAYYPRMAASMFILWFWWQKTLLQEAAKKAELAAATKKR